MDRAMSSNSAAASPRTSRLMPLVPDSPARSASSSLPAEPLPSDLPLVSAVSSRRMRSASTMRPEECVLQLRHAAAEARGGATVRNGLTRKRAESVVDGGQRFPLRSVALQRPGGDREEGEQQAPAGNERGGGERGQRAARRVGGGDDEEDHGRHPDSAGRIPEDD